MQKKINRREHPGRHHMVGDGFRVTQYIPGYGREMSNDTSPFLMLDYNAPWPVSPQGTHRPGVGYHPHRGFETVTIVYSGEIEHRDTAGGGGVIGPDEVQWMTAGSGLMHNEFMTERFAQMGGIQHVVQLWINLPRTKKMVPPQYQALTKTSIPEREYTGGKVRVISGILSMYDHNTGTDIQQAGGAKTFTPVELYDIQNSGQSHIRITLPEGHNAMVLIVEGAICINETLLKQGDIVFFSPSGTDIDITSDQSISRILVMGGAPLDESVAAYGPFVMNTHDEIIQAFADFRDGKMGYVDE